MKTGAAAARFLREARVTGQLEPKAKRGSSTSKADASVGSTPVATRYQGAGPRTGGMKTPEREGLFTIPISEGNPRPLFTGNRMGKTVSAQGRILAEGCREVD